jgi:cleavage and polyadenylation specificity factor subunit 2
MLSRWVCPDVFIPFSAVKFCADDVDACFEQTIQLKFSQRYTVRASGVLIEITPYNAGHSIGCAMICRGVCVCFNQYPLNDSGAIWMIKRESDEIVYAVDYNHKSERHLNPSLLETISKPTLLITDALNTFYNESARKQRESQLLGPFVLNLI